MTNNSAPISNSRRLSLSGENSPNSSAFYEVLYVGKIRISSKRTVKTFIDDSVNRFKTQEADRIKQQEILFDNSKKETDTSDESICDGKSKNNSSSDEGKIFHPLMPLPSNKSNGNNQTSPVSKSQSSGHLKQDIRAFSEKRLFEDSEANSSKEKVEEFRERAASTSALQKNRVAKRKESIGNNTMLMQIGRSDIRLIYPDRRQILFNKCLKDVIHCEEGVHHAEYFGFICRDHSSGGSMGYVFKCQSPSFVNDVVTCLRTAHQFVQEKIHRENNRTCTSCPMFMYQQLVRDMDGAATNRLAHSILLKRLDKLPEDERNSIMDKLTGAETSDIEEKNEIIMVLLKANCEIKQKSHKHSADDAMDNKSVFLNEVGGSILRAKRSLTNSFSDMIKRKTSVDGTFLSSVHLNDHSTSPIQECDEDIQIRRRSQTVGSAARDTLQREMVGAGSKIALFIRSSNQSSAPLAPNKNFLRTPECMSPSKTSISGTPRARREIFRRVVTPAKQKDSSTTSEKRDYNMLWKRAIKQQILLIRMERENKKIIASQVEAEERRQKLDYAQILSPIDDWIDFNTNYDSHNLEIKMPKGVPKAKRGDVWKYLSENRRSHWESSDEFKYVPYSNLKQNLTPHQHSIIIDLGRTFPNHPYFSTSLGPGQLALYNVLKAYSLLDIEVGYCQGLAFVAGVLLMHTNSEEEAFNLLKHLMFDLGFRKQYQSDLIGLQIQMYQLSRLLHDVQRDIFDHIEEIGIDPSLYATSWFLTIFASNFPLGFVVRVFDLIFLQGLEGLFKVALCLISISKEYILSCKSLDNLMLFMKTEIPEMELDKLNEVLDRAFSLSFSKQLNSYEVEYHVLQEELMTQSNSSSDLDLDSLRSENEELKKKLKIYQELATTESVLRFLPSNQDTFSRHEIVSLLDKALYINLENHV